MSGFCAVSGQVKMAGLGAYTIAFDKMSSVEKFVIEVTWKKSSIRYHLGSRQDKTSCNECPFPKKFPLLDLSC